MTIVDLIISWEQRAKCNFWDAEQVENPIEKKIV